MAVKKIPVPFCDWCGLPFLPKFLLKDGTRNPIFDHPEKSKRCGKCKRTGWNAGGVDRRRKKPAPAEEIPPVTMRDVIEAVPSLEGNLKTVPAAKRCRHGLYKCQKCHPENLA